MALGFHPGYAAHFLRLSFLTHISLPQWIVLQSCSIVYCITVMFHSVLYYSHGMLLEAYATRIRWAPGFMDKVHPCGTFSKSTQ